jgi:hypothetical protein
MRAAIGPIVGLFNSLRVKDYFKTLKEFTIPPETPDRIQPCDTESVEVSELEYVFQTSYPTIIEPIGSASRV